MFEIRPSFLEILRTEFRKHVQLEFVSVFPFRLLTKELANTWKVCELMLR